MPLAAIPKHWKRYKDIAWLLIKYGRSDLLRGLEVDSDLFEQQRPEPPSNAEELARDLENLWAHFHQAGTAPLDARRPASADLPDRACPPAGRRRAFLVRGGREDRHH